MFLTPTPLSGSHEWLQPSGKEPAISGHDYKDRVVADLCEAVDKVLPILLVKIANFFKVFADRSGDIIMIISALFRIFA